MPKRLFHESQQKEHIERPFEQSSPHVQQIIERGVFTDSNAFEEAKVSPVGHSTPP